MDLNRGLLIVLAAVLFVLSVALVMPFLQYFLLAVVLAYALAPLQDRLTARPRIGRGTGAALLVAGTAVAVIVPLVFVSRLVVSGAADILTQISEGEITLGQFERRINEQFGLRVDLAAQLQSLAEGIGSGSVEDLFGLFGIVTHAMIGLGLTLFLLYYFLKDGDRFLAWLREVAPLPVRVVDDLVEAIDRVTGAVLAGHVLVAVVQGAIAGIGLFVVGIPNAVFWTAVMIVLSLLPVIGSFLVWGPAALYLLAVGRPLAALFLTVYGTVVVGVSDDYLRPVVVDRYAKVNPSVIIIGVLGGIYVIGFMGIFFGPVVIGALRATLDVYSEEYGSAPTT